MHSPSTYLPSEQSQVAPKLRGRVGAEVIGGVSSASVARSDVALAESGPALRPCPCPFGTGSGRVRDGVRSEGALCDALCDASRRAGQNLGSQIEWSSAAWRFFRSRYRS